VANRPDIADAELVRAIRERIGEGAWHVVAADGGARLALALGMNPAVVVGDMDSLEEPFRRVLEQGGCRFIVYSQEKDYTDTHLAMDWAYLNGFREVCVIVHRSGRLDHVLGAIWAACRYVEMDAAVRFVDAGFEAALLRGPSVAEIRGAPGLIVSLLPLSRGAAGITLTGGVAAG